MIASPKGLGPERDCAGKAQRHTQKTDPQRGRPTKRGPWLWNSNKYLVMSPRRWSTPRLTDWLTVSRSVPLTLWGNHENANVRNIGQGEPRHRKYKSLKLGGVQAYDRSSDWTAVVGATKVRAWAAVLSPDWQRPCIYCDMSTPTWITQQSVARQPAGKQDFRVDTMTSRNSIGIRFLRNMPRWRHTALE
jgi:hypothetical protein